MTVHAMKWTLLGLAVAVILLAAVFVVVSVDAHSAVEFVRSSWGQTATVLDIDRSSWG